MGSEAQDDYLSKVTYNIPVIHPYWIVQKTISSSKKAPVVTNDQAVEYARQAAGEARIIAARVKLQTAPILRTTTQLPI